MELLLIRHGEADYTQRDGATSYGEGAPLTELGRRQAELLAARLAGARIDHLYASPLLRARHTAEAVAAATERPVRVDPRFREIDIGALRIARPEDARKAISSMVTGKGPMVLDFSKHGGEGAAAFGERVAAAMHDLVLAPHGASEERVAIVCHGGFINAALYAFLDLPFTGVARFGVGNCSITTVRVQGEARVITAVNDCAHLASLAGVGSPVASPRDQMTLGR